MNSIFFRIYFGILLSVVIIVGLTWGAIETVNGYRMEVYRESMAQGVFYVMARGVARQPPETREQRVALISRLMGVPFELLDWQDQALSSRETERLRDHRVLIRLQPETEIADIYMLVPDTEQLLKVSMLKVSEQQARATALFVLDELSQYPISDWDAALQELQKQFYVPIFIVPREDIVLDNEQSMRLIRNEIVVALGEGRGAGSGITIYAPVGNTGKVLGIGPMHLLDWYPPEMLLLAAVVDLLLIGLVGYLLVRPLQHSLVDLGVALRRMRAGDLTARAAVSTSSADLRNLAETFNGMAEHIRRLIDSQRELTRAVSHELRTPVARIRFGVEMMQGTGEIDEREKQALEIDRDIDQLDRLIDEILTYARLEEGTPALNIEKVDVRELMQRIALELEPLAGSIRLRVLGPSGDPLWVDAEERYLHRVLQNLVTNAIKYARSCIELRAEIVGENCILVVSDDGPGIPEQDWQKIFMPFARLDDSRSRASGGYGLGLSIVRRIADWHGGRVSVARSPMGGAEFVFEMPRQQPGKHALS